MGDAAPIQLDVEINFPRRHDAGDRAKMPIAGQFRDFELAQRCEIGAGQHKQRRSEFKQSHGPAARLNSIHLPPGGHRRPALNSDGTARQGRRAWIAV